MAVDAPPARKRQREDASTETETAVSAHAFPFTAAQSSFIGLQMAPFRLVPLGAPQWQRLRDGFLLQFPTLRRPKPTLKQYKYEAIRVEYDQYREEVMHVKRQFPFDDPESVRKRGDAVNALIRQAATRQRLHPGAIQWDDSEEEGEEEEDEEEAGEEEEGEEERKEEEEEEREATWAYEARRRAPRKPCQTINEEQSAWILTQMEPYRAVPLGEPQWKRLYKQFLKRFPQARGVYSLRQYQHHTKHLEQERFERERWELSCIRYPGRPFTREIGAEYQAHKKCIDALDRIKKEVRDRDRSPPRGRYEKGESEDEEWRSSDEEEVEEETDETEEGAAQRGGGRASSRLAQFEALLKERDDEVKQWKDKCEALSTTAERLKMQLEEKTEALREAEVKLQQITATASAAAETTAPPVAVPNQTVAVGPIQAPGGQTFVFNLYLNGVAASTTQ